MWKLLVFYERFQVILDNFKDFNKFCLIWEDLKVGIFFEEFVSDITNFEIIYGISNYCKQVVGILLEPREFIEILLNSYDIRGF